MCGFIGYVNLKHQKSRNFYLTKNDGKRKKNSLKTIENRGPDAVGEWEDEHIWLGHRRLSIIDTSSRGDQPMERGKFVIAFNGMIYNFREIRDTLVQIGHNFRTNTDTEVILAGWAEWGEDLLPRLCGMFAFAIWNKTSKTLHLVRDRFGKKPLYFRNWRDSVAFGSRFDSVEALTENATLSQEALTWLVNLKYIPDPYSASIDIHKVPAGHLVTLSPNKQTTKRWYQPEPDARALTLPLPNQQTQLYTLLNEAVEKRLVSDVPIACFLSGGIDSAIITALARQHRNIDSFTVGFDDSIFDESKLARETAKHLGTKHHEVRFKSEDQLILVEQLFNSALDEPFGDSSALPSLFVSEAIKDQATVALSGDGADELFGGYRKYQGELAVHHWQRLPSSLRFALKQLINRLPRSRANGLTNKIRQIHRFLYGAELGDLERHATWMAMTSSATDIQDVLSTDKRHDIVNLLQSIDTPDGMDMLSKVLLRDIGTVLISDMLVKIDRTSMYNGVEVRSPFLDHKIVEMSLAIDGSNKISWNQGKKLLRDMFKIYLPQHVFDTAKRGFEMPLNKWLCGPLEKHLTKALHPDFLSYNKINPTLGRIVSSGIMRGELPHAELGWTLISIYYWQQRRGFV